MGITRIQFRRGTAAHWTDENPTLFPGEPGFESDTRKLKIGDGKTPWRELPYRSSTDVVEITEEAVLAAWPIVQPFVVNVIENEVVEEVSDILDNGPALDLLYQNAKV